MSDEKTLPIDTETGFDLDDILNGISAAEVEAKIYIDSRSVAEYTATVEEYLEAKAEAEKAYDDGSTTITDDSVGAVDKKYLAILDALREKFEASTMKVRVRALASSEITAVRRKVVKEFEIPNNATVAQREEAQNEQQHLAYTHFLSLAIVSMEKDGKKRSGATFDEVQKMRDHLPESEWARLTEAFDRAQALAKVSEEILSDAAFRGDESESAV